MKTLRKDNNREGLPVVGIEGEPRFSCRVLNIESFEDCTNAISKTGADISAFKKLTEKIRHINIMVRDVTARQGIILKQEMLSLGGDTIVPKYFLESLDLKGTVIICGTVRQVRSLCEKLNGQPFGLSMMGKRITEIINNLEKERFELEFPYRGRIELGKETKVMGILNITPDSFYDGGFYFRKEDAIRRGIEMVEEGADIIDIGGESTRPNSKPVPLIEEKRRVIPVIEELRKKIDIPISIDTYKAEVAEDAIKAGADMVNDISGFGFDESMIEVVAKYRVPVVIMHIRGRPETMQKDLRYTNLMGEILSHLEDRIAKAVSGGVGLDKVVIDPGIGFGKSAEQNIFILKNLHEFKALGRPILVGTSRKSFLKKLFGWDLQERLEGSLSSSLLSLFKGAHILRVHDVKETKKAVIVANTIKNIQIDES